MLPTALNAINELVTTPKSAPSGPGAEDFLAAVRAQLDALAKPLKEDEDVAVYVERMRVFDLELAAGGLLVMHGIDPEGARTTTLAHFGGVQFICKILKLKPGTKKRPVGVHLPKPAK